MQRNYVKKEQQLNCSEFSIIQIKSCRIEMSNVKHGVQTHEKETQTHIWCKKICFEYPDIIYILQAV